MGTMDRETVLDCLSLLRHCAFDKSIADESARLYGQATHLLMAHPTTVMRTHSTVASLLTRTCRRLKERYPDVMAIRAGTSAADVSKEIRDEIVTWSSTISARALSALTDALTDIWASSAEVSRTARAEHDRERPVAPLERTGTASRSGTGEGSSIHRVDISSTDEDGDSGDGSKKRTGPEESHEVPPESKRQRSHSDERSDSVTTEPESMDVDQGKVKNDEEGERPHIFAADTHTPRARLRSEDHKESRRKKPSRCNR